MWFRSLKREFQENRRRFFQHSPVPRPIVGYSCWALGYLDPKGRRVGCLLHPMRHGGRDLRHLTGYGAKCSREQCLASRIFQEMSPPAQRFWLHLAEGLCTFYYSSPKANPLFHVLLWGEDILEALARAAISKAWSATELVWKYPFLLSEQWQPRADRFLFEVVFFSLGIDSNRPWPEPPARPQRTMNVAPQAWETPHFGGDIHITAMGGATSPPQQSMKVALTSVGISAAYSDIHIKEMGDETGSGRHRVLASLPKNEILTGRARRLHRFARRRVVEAFAFSQNVRPWVYLHQAPVRASFADYVRIYGGRRKANAKLLEELEKVVRDEALKLDQSEHNG